MQSRVTGAMLDGMVKTRISNLVITGDAANHGNFTSWRRYTVSVAEILGFNHITDHLLRMSSQSSKDTPLESVVATEPTFGEIANILGQLVQDLPTTCS